MKPAPLEQAYIKYLNARGTVPASSKVPNPRPDAFIKLTRTGGQHRALVLSDASLLVECWGATDSLAWRACGEAWGLIRESAYSGVDGISVHRVILTEPVNNPDIESGASRFQFIATILVTMSEEN